jgi:predicted Ser/Thr protein kinase
MATATIPISEAEHVALIRKSTDGRVVACVFGGNKVALQVRRENDWAFRELAVLRGADPNISINWDQIQREG